MMRFYMADTGGDYAWRRNCGLSFYARREHLKEGGTVEEGANTRIALNGFRVFWGTR